MFTVDIRSRVPIYEQLVKNITDLITSGALSPDEQLPSVRSLARDIGINPNTVQKAYQDLENKGLIYQAAGRGSFIAPGDALTQAVIEGKLKALNAPIKEAAYAGIKKVTVMELVDQIYSEEQKL